VNEDDIVEVTGNVLKNSDSTSVGLGIGGVMGGTVGGGGGVQQGAGIAGGVGGSVGGSVEGIASVGEGDAHWLPPDTTYYPDPHRQMAKSPTKPNLRLKDVIADYCAPNLVSATTDFLLHRVQIPRHDLLLSDYNHIHIWHRLYLHHQPLPFAPLEPPRRDVIRASPTTLDVAGRVHKSGVWDTVLFRDQPNRRGKLIFVFFPLSSPEPHIQPSGPALNEREKHGILRKYLPLACHPYIPPHMYPSTPSSTL
jgi:hypothetical protein